MARTQLTLSTINLYNLNEPGIRMYRNSDGWSQDEYDKKIKWLSNALPNLESDVFAFQELWHEDSLKKVFSESNLLGQYTLLVPKNHTGKKIVCAGAVKSDLLVGEPEWIELFPDAFKLDSSGDDDQTPDITVNINAFSRPVLHFKIKPRSNGKVIHVYVCHFKSKGPTKIYREDWYTKEAYSKHSEAICNPPVLNRSYK